MTEPSRAQDRDGGPDDVHTGLTAEAFKRAYADNLRYALGRFPAVATRNDRYLALAHAVRDRLMDRWMRSGEAFYRARARTMIEPVFLIPPVSIPRIRSRGALVVSPERSDENAVGSPQTSTPPDRT